MSMLPTQIPEILQIQQGMMPKQESPTGFQGVVQALQPVLSDLSYQYSRSNLTPQQAIQADAMRQQQILSEQREKRDAELAQRKEFLQLLQMERDAKYAQQGYELQQQELQLRRQSMGADLALKRELMSAELAEKAAQKEALLGMGYSPEQLAGLGVDLVAEMEVDKIGPSTKEFTEGQAATAAFANRMINVAPKINEIEDAKIASGESLTPLASSVLGAIPFGLGETPAKAVMDEDMQLYKNAANEWIRAKLRRESGAVISDTEARSEYETYFPMLGDKPETLKQKRKLRETVEKGLQSQSQGAYSYLFDRKGDENVINFNGIEIEID